MSDEFLYLSRTQLEMKDGFRNAYLGEISEAVVYGVQGALREYYGASPEAPAVASTLDHIVAAVGG